MPGQLLMDLLNAWPGLVHNSTVNLLCHSKREREELIGREVTVYRSIVSVCPLQELFLALQLHVKEKKLSRAARERRAKSCSCRLQTH